MQVPALDLTAAYAALRSEIDDAVLRVVRSGHYVLGPEVSAFEREFAAYCGVSACVGVASGSDALVLALRALGVGPGDEVLVPSATFIATVTAVTDVGAVPVFVDILPDTYVMDPDQVRRLITSRTKAILPVHLYGHAAPMDRLAEVANDFGIAMIEDCAQATGTKLAGRRVGSFGSLSCFSFYPGKNLGAFGDAGAVLTNSKLYEDRLRLLRNYGRRPGAHYEHEIKGFNSRLDEVHAAVLRVKLRHLDAWNARRAQIAKRYSEGLCSAYQLPVVDPDCEHTWHLYVVQHPQRDRIVAQLKGNGIGASIHYPTPVHKLAAFREFNNLRLPYTEQAFSRILSLPIDPFMTDAQVDLVISCANGLA